MKIKRFSDRPDPMKFIIPEIGEDEKGKYAIVSAKNMETGEIITKKMYEDKTYDSQKDFSETVGDSSSEAVSSEGGGGEGENTTPEPEPKRDTILLAPGTTYYVIGRRIKRKKKET